MRKSCEQETWQDRELVMSMVAYDAVGCSQFAGDVDSYRKKKTLCLHWLRAPIQFKLATLTYMSLRGLAPRYLADDLRRVADMPSRRSLQSSSSHQLDVPRTRLVSVGDRGHSVRPALGCGTPCRVELWNVRLWKLSDENWNISFLVCHFQDISRVSCLFVPCIMLVDLEVFYLGHLKNFYTIQDIIQYKFFNDTGFGQI